MAFLRLENHAGSTAADAELSELTAVTNVLTGDEFVLARSGASKKITAANLAVGTAGLNPAANVAPATASTASNTAQLNAVIAALIAAGYMAAA